MASQITCITKPGGHHNTHEHITHVGGVRSDGAKFYITRQRCADDIDSRADSYFVRVGQNQATVTTYLKNGVKFIKTTPDSTTKDNLLNLQDCS